MGGFIERCEDELDKVGIHLLTADERLQIEEMECEGLMPSQAPEFIKAIRKRDADRAERAEKKKATLTAKEFAELLDGTTVKTTFNRATLTVAELPVHGAEGVTERRFVMEGPSGKHTLLVDATDLARLNAHWTIFATDARNGIALEHGAQMAVGMEMGLTPAETRMLIG